MYTSQSVKVSKFERYRPIKHNNDCLLNCLFLEKDEEIIKLKIKIKKNIMTKYK